MENSNKNKSHQFLDYLEDYASIREFKKQQDQEENSWQAEAHDKQIQQNKALIWIYILSGTFVLIIVFFWWNISRDNFYKALANPVQDEVFQEFLGLVNDAKENGSGDLDWREEVKNIEVDNLNVEEQATLEILQEKVESGASLNEIINEIK